MISVQDLLTRARERAGVSSDRALSKQLGLSHAALHKIGKGQAFPSDDTMMRLAAVSGIAPEEALLLLNVWRKTGATNTTYRRLLNRLNSKSASEAAA